MKSILIYILDDQQSALDTLEALLNNHGFMNIKKFTNPEIMLAALTDEVRIVLIDFKLDHAMNGIDVIIEINKQERWIYFMMISGMQGESIIRKYCNLATRGMYILKGQLQTDNEIIEGLMRIVHDIWAVRQVHKAQGEAVDMIKELRELVKGGG